jgi:deoxyribonuclease-4
LRIGIHTSRAGSLEHAALKAEELCANTFQIFSSSPRMWRASTPDPADVKRFRAARERFDLRPLVIHVNYLVNLATLDPVVRERSVASFRGELDRAARTSKRAAITSCSKEPTRRSSTSSTRQRWRRPAAG